MYVASGEGIERKRESERAREKEIIYGVSHVES